MSTQQDRSETLDFRDEPGSSRSKWVAGLLALALAGWMGSGFILPSAPDEEEAGPVEAIEAVAVAVRQSRAEEVTRVFTAEGQAEPDRRATLRAETSGEVEKVSARRGDRLAQGDVIARLGTRELQARVEGAREEVARARREYENARTLLDRGTSTVDRVAQARAILAAAEAAQTEAEEALEDTIIRAPFDGRLDAFSLDEGTFVSVGAEVGRVLDSDPLSIVIQVPQQSLARIEEGQRAMVEFITGEEREGRVDYVSSDADPETRTFRAEILVPNPDFDMASGLSVQVRIPTGTLEAHFVSPAILSLGTDGALGVKTVDENDEVAFHEVSIERAQTDGVWISGLPETVRLITVGQGFVNAGEKVAPQPEDGVPQRAGGETPAQADAETTE